MFGIVALTAPKRTFRKCDCNRADDLLSNFKRLTMASKHPPRMSPMRCTSSINTAATSLKNDIPPRFASRRVTRSNFSGVAKIASTFSISPHTSPPKSLSPVNSANVIPIRPNRSRHSRAFSLTKARLGAR